MSATIRRRGRRTATIAIRSVSLGPLRPPSDFRGPRAVRFAVADLAYVTLFLLRGFREWLTVHRIAIRLLGREWPGLIGNLRAIQRVPRGRLQSGHSTLWAF